MQPLSYQLAETSCWVACMLNGIRCLLRQNRLVTPVYRIVHCLLQDRGVVYYKERELEALNEVYRRLEKYTGLAFEPIFEGESSVFPKTPEDRCGCGVKSTLRRLELNCNQVAICDVGNGDHSILLTERNGDWLKAFDPYWYEQREANANVQIVDEWHANIEILQGHLLDDGLQAHKEAYARGQAYPMGQNPETRFVTVIRGNG